MSSIVSSMGRIALDLNSLETEFAAKSAMIRSGRLKLAIVSDFDDTMFDVTKSMHRATEEIKGRRMGKAEVHELPPDEKMAVYTTAYTKYDHTLEPNFALIDFYKRMYDAGAHIIVVSARRENLREKTEEKLKKHSIKFKEVVLRPNEGYGGEPELEEWKAKMVEEIMKDYDEALLFEDMGYIIDHIMNRMKHKGIRYFLVKYPNEISEIR